MVGREKKTEADTISKATRNVSFRTRHGRRGVHMGAPAVPASEALSGVGMRCRQG